MTVSTLLPSRPAAAPKTPVPYLALLAIGLSAAFLAGVACFSLPAAAILYAPLYLVLCYFQPGIALWVMFAEVSFPYNVGGTDAVHMAPAEISLCLAYPVFWLRAYAARQPRVSNPIFSSVIVYFLICTLSSLVHWTARDAAVSILQMFIYLVLAVKFFSSCVINPRHVYAALYGLISSCTFVSLYLLITQANDVLDVHKNATGTFLSYAVIILSELWFAATTNKKPKFWLSLLLLINVGGLVMSTSRGAWMGAAAGLLVLMICRRQYAMFARALMVLIPIVALFWLFVPAELREYATDLRTTNNDFGARIDTIARYEQEFKQSPIIGMGIGLRKEIDSTNIVMSTLAETGIVGLAAFMSIQLVFLWRMLQAAWKAPRDHPDMTFLGLGMALVLCLFTHGCVDHYWSRTQLPVWGMAGAAIAVWSAQQAMFSRQRRIAPLR